MRRMALILLLGLAPAFGVGAAEGGEALMNANVDVSDNASLQRGAKLFNNYCMGCHSLQYLRYSRMAADLQIPEELVKQYLIWDGSKITDSMTSAMPASAAKDWFGKVPPDLTLTVRSQGADWVYTYLNSFYRDPSQANGVNNLLLPGVSMPHVLWQLQGMPEAVYEEHGEGEPVPVGVEVAEGAGKLTPAEYHRATRDITNFLAYAAEPVKAKRQSLGIYVILFLIVFTAMAYLLKREFWKDVH